MHKRWTIRDAERGRGGWQAPAGRLLLLSLAAIMVAVTLAATVSQSAFSASPAKPSQTAPSRGLGGVGLRQAVEIPALAGFAHSAGNAEARDNALSVVALSSSGTPATSELPRRIVSLNLCTDQLLLMLAPERVVALSTLAADPLLSVMAEQAKRFPAVRGDAEEVLRHAPDFVVAAPFAARSAVDLLRRLGKRVAVVELGQDIDGLKHTLRTLAQAVGADTRAREITAALDQQLDGIKAATDHPRPSALILNYGGLPSGPGSVADTALQLAGYRNAAADYAANLMGAIPLELIVARPPDLLVLGQDANDYASVRADNLRHPALAALTRKVPSTSLPQRLTLCALPQITEAVARLVAVRDAAPASPAARKSLP